MFHLVFGNLLSVWKFTIITITKTVIIITIMDKYLNNPIYLDYLTALVTTNTFGKFYCEFLHTYRVCSYKF